MIHSLSQGTSPRMSIADIIHTRRKQLSLSQAELATRIGVSRAAIGQWEAGQTAPSRRHAPDVARALELELAVLFAAMPQPLVAVDSATWSRQVGLMGMDAFIAGVVDIAGLPRVSVAGSLPEDAVALRVTDASMAPRYSPGDLVIASRSTKPIDGEDVVAIVDGDGLLRTFRDRGNDRDGKPVFDLLSTAPDFPTITCNSVNGYKVLATIVGHWRLTRK